jgi:hypothetical protein
VHSDHLVLRLVIVGGALLAVLAHRVVQVLAPTVVVGGVVILIGVHRPEVLGERAQRRGQLLIGRRGRRPCGGSAITGQRNGPQERRFGMRSTNVTSVCQLLALS